MRLTVLSIVCCAAFAGIGFAEEVSEYTITLECAQIEDGGPIPVEYTGDGEDISPPLKWSGVPHGTKEWALICDDPDAPTPKPWVHWVIYNIPADATKLTQALPQAATLEEPEELKGVQQGLTGWRSPGYRGPAPPPGKDHHYTFVLYALDTDLDTKAGITKDELLTAMEGHVLAKGKLVGVYKR